MNVLDVKVKVNGTPDGKFIFVRSVEYPEGVSAPDVLLLEKAMRILFDKMDVNVIFTFSRY